MKYIIILALLLSCQNQKTNNEPTPISTTEEQIAKDLIQGAFDDLWAGVDSTKIKKYHTDDFIILENGEIWDNDRIKVYMKRQLSNPDRAKRTNRMEYIAVEKYGESMQIAYYNYAEFTKADSIVGNARWLESALVVQTKDGWKLKMMHSTRANK